MATNTLEDKVKKLADKASKITDSKIRSDMEREIAAIKAEMQKAAQKPAKPTTPSGPPKEIPITGTAPMDLTQNYVFVEDKRFKSDIFSSDEKTYSWLGARLSARTKEAICGRSGDILKYNYNHESYEGRAADFISQSLVGRMQDYARKNRIDLVIVQFYRNKSPFRYNIYSVKGLAESNFVGEITAKLYRKK
jgi:hypothetical protein